MYLFNVSNWAHLVGLKLTDFSLLVEWRTRMSQRPAVRAAMKAEGLLK
jgi:glutathione S-transferase